MGVHFPFLCHETWNIFTDLVPLFLFIRAWVRVPARVPLDVHGLLAGIVASRACSLAFHLADRRSARRARTWQAVDAFSVSCMSLGAPWMLRVARAPASAWRPFMTVLLSLVASHASAAQRGAAAEPVLQLLVAAWGHAPAAWAAAGAAPEPVARLCAQAVAWLGLGFLFFYTLGLPESFFFRHTPGALRGHPWHSHVLWHAAASLGQAALVRAAFVLP